MLQKVWKIAQNPLEAAAMQEADDLAMEQLEKEGKLKEFQQKLQDRNLETAILERLIIKIGALLAIGFGEAGSEIIAQNMQRKGEVDPMIPGKKIYAVFGFCSIKNFQDITEILQTQVMVFVNEIAQITHSTVDQYCGSNNKNIGEAFLMIWKYPDTSVI